MVDPVTVAVLALVLQLKFWITFFDAANRTKNLSKYDLMRVQLELTVALGGTTQKTLGNHMELRMHNYSKLYVQIMISWEN